MWRNETKCKYMFMFPLKNLARKGLRCVRGGYPILQPPPGDTASLVFANHIMYGCDCFSYTVNGAVKQDTYHCSTEYYQAMYTR